MSNIQTLEYKDFIKRIKLKAQKTQIKASVKVNIELLKFYWELGEEVILENNLQAGGREIQYILFLIIQQT